MWTDIPKTLSKICVNISKCQSMLFKTNILMKMKLYQYFYEKKIFEIQIPTRSKKYFYYAINCLHLWICNGSIKYFQIFACLFWGILCKWNLHHCGQRWGKAWFWDAAQNRFVPHWREPQYLQKVKEQVDKDLAQKSQSDEVSERGALISTDLDLKQKEAGGWAARHLFPTAARGAACRVAAVLWVGIPAPAPRQKELSFQLRGIE